MIPSFVHGLHYKLEMSSCCIFTWHVKQSINQESTLSCYLTFITRFTLFMVKAFYYTIDQDSQQVTQTALWIHDDVIKWKHFPRNWPFVRGIHRSPVNSSHKGQWRGALKFSLICVWINDWVNNREAGDLRRYLAHYDVIVMICRIFSWENAVLFSPRNLGWVLLSPFPVPLF